jgi:hypothetical protein
MSFLRLCRAVGHLEDAEQSPFTHWTPAAQEVLPQHVRPAAAQNGELPVVQQSWPALQPTETPAAPQQNPPEGEQNCPDGPVQQVWPALQPVVPQHNPAEGEQYVLVPPGTVQQVWLAWQEVLALLPQHTPPAAIQKLPGQQRKPGLQAGVQVAACASLIPRAPKMAAATTLVSCLSACRRGIGLARMRAASSTRLLINLFLSRVGFNYT